MSLVRVLAFPMLLATAAACANTSANTAPRPLKPDDGPGASIRVGYSGGLINRSLSAYIRTDESAYVIVGHLGGDGVIRILYPETPMESGFIRGKRTIQTATTTAAYDGIPSLFSYTMATHRSLGSLYDSYDGRGHGYVFVVASRSPLRYDLLMDSQGWSDWQVDDYDRSYDPRYAIRDFAETLAGGRAYTLRFATSFSTSQYDAFASRAWDCALLSNIGFFTFSPWWNSWNYGALGYRHSYGSYCGGGYGFGGRYAYNTLHRGPVVATIIPVTTPPQRPTLPAPSLDRPGRRGLDRNTGPEDTRTHASFTRIPSGFSDRGESLSRRTAPTRERPAGGDLGRRAPGVARTGDAPARPTQHERFVESGSRARRGTGSPSTSGETRTRETRSSGSSSPSSSETRTRETRSSGSTPTSSSSPRSERPAVSNPREVRTSGKPDHQ